MSPGVNNRVGPRMRVCLDLGTALSKASLFLGEDLPPRSATAPLPIGFACGAEHPLLAPSAMYVDGGRIYFGPIALERARGSGEARRLPILSFKMVPLGARDRADAGAQAEPVCRSFRLALSSRCAGALYCLP